MPGQDVVDRRRGRCCRRSSGARAARGRPRRRGRPRGRRRASRPRRRRRAARASPSAAARGFGGDAAAAGLLVARRSCRWLRCAPARLPGCARPPSALGRGASRRRLLGSARLRRRRRRARRRASCGRARRGCRGGAFWRGLLPSSAGSAGRDGRPAQAGATAGAAASGGACSSVVPCASGGTRKWQTKSPWTCARAERRRGCGRGRALRVMVKDVGMACRQGSSRCRRGSGGVGPTRRRGAAARGGRGSRAGAGRGGPRPTARPRRSGARVWPRVASRYSNQASASSIMQQLVRLARDRPSRLPPGRCREALGPGSDGSRRRIAASSLSRDARSSACAASPTARVPA